MPAARFHSLDEWLHWQESLHPSEIELKLERIKVVADRLGLLQPNTSHTTVITVAGTNGKGSCVATLVGLINHFGLRVGAYTSPHVLRYNERVSIDGQAASDESLCEAFQAIDEAREDISLTYFEFGTLAGLYLFQRENLDFWVLEVGLGGRLDATNIIDADLSIITAIALDHCEWLGDTRDLIALEKAGICRSGKPAVVVDPDPPESLIPWLKANSVPAVFLGEDFEISSVDRDSQTTLFDFQKEGQLQSSVQLPVYSMAAALKALLILEVFTLSDATVKSTLEAYAETISLPGRFQQLEINDKTVVLDVAHNPAAMQYLIKRLPDKHYFVVFAAMADKDYREMLEMLAPLAEHFYFCALPNFPRAASPQTLLEAVTTIKTVRGASCFDTVADGLQAALDANFSDQAILVAGSFYTVAAATAFLQETSLPVLDTTL